MKKKEGRGIGQACLEETLIPDPRNPKPFPATVSEQVTGSIYQAVCIEHSRSTSNNRAFPSQVLVIIENFRSKY